jgi:hypothetical protein
VEFGGELGDLNRGLGLIGQSLLLYHG